MTTQFFYGQCFSVFFLFNLIFSASFLVESFRMTLPLLPIPFRQWHHSMFSVSMCQLRHLFHLILLGFYLQECYHLLIQECLNISSLNIDIGPTLSFSNTIVCLSIWEDKMTVQAFPCEFVISKAYLIPLIYNIITLESSWFRINQWKLGAPFWQINNIVNMSFPL